MVPKKADGDRVLKHACSGAVLVGRMETSIPRCSWSEIFER